MDKRKKFNSSSEMLLKIAQDENLKKNLTYKNLVGILQRRTFGFVLLIFSLPSALPFSLIPGFSVVFSIPLIFFAGQMMIGSKSVWIPSFLANKELSHEKLSKIICLTVPYLQKMEHLLKARWLYMTSPLAEKLNGLIILLLAIGVLLPIPLTNAWMAVIIVIFALGIIEDDGLVIAIAWLAAIISLILIPTFIWKIVNFFF